MERMESNYVRVSDGQYSSSNSNEYYSGVFNREGKLLQGQQFSPSNGTAVSVASPIDFIAGGIIAGATTKLLLKLAPKVTTIALGWTAGTNLGEAAYGKSSGVNPLHPGDFGRHLSTDERVSRGVTGVVVGASASLLIRGATRPSLQTTQKVSRAGKTAEQAKAEALEKDIKAFMAMGLSEAEAREMAIYVADVAPAQAVPQPPMGGGHRPYNHSSYFPRW
jgi:hypothetical protein